MTCYLVDMPKKTLDSETMIVETQKRVWGALKKGYEYSGVVDESEDFFENMCFLN